MAISFTPTTNEEEKSFPFWVIWIIIPIITLTLIVYFIAFQKIPENEIIPQKETAGLTIEELQKMEEILKKIEEPSFKNLAPVAPNFFLQTPAVPPEKTGRSNPFAPIE
ncbi:MAG TPA: hypothetical protein PLL80_02395 [Candidatus Pacearchaeota archaeon]|nr:hypothetical protein [Candidatus Pacearchaeota archaeon]HOK94290.1 hypothetical protein [Candidatus Pacearchaeota archaeon]HPO75434.1 hypothetical protein [Candidatus Pacearchaeota archaeon]